MTHALFKRRALPLTLAAMAAGGMLASTPAYTTSLHSAVKKALKAKTL